jgi:hypothetical protein
VKRLLFLFLLVSLPAMAAERLAVRVQYEGTSSVAELEHVRTQVEALARELTGLSVTRSPEGRQARRCGVDDACLRTVAAAARTEHVLVLGLVPRRPGTADVDVAWVDTLGGGVVKRWVGGASLATLAPGVRPAVAALVPAFARRGWGGLVAQGLSRLRVDGRMLAEPDQVVALTAGPHEVDLLLPSGEALLIREQVPEGARLRLEPGQLDVTRSGAAPAPRGKGLRTASYVTFSLGALAVAGSLVAGGLSRGALRGVEPCDGRVRDCTSFPTASFAHERAARYAQTGNVLLGAGAGLTVVGSGLFVFDLLSTDSE